MIYETLLSLTSLCCLYKFYKTRKINTEIYIDELTGMYNRKVMNRVKSLDKKNKYVVVAYDIDHFKNVNDTYGHSVGDVALKSVSNVIKNKFTKDGEFNVRFGGEEFFSFIINHDKNHDNIINLIDEVRTEIEELSIVADGNLIKLTISIGIVFYNEEKLLRDRVEISDKRLYKAKKNGRNRLCFEGDTNV